MRVNFNPKNKDIEHLFDNLMKYPMQTVDSKTAQSLSRYRTIRMLNRKEPKILIRKGVVGLKPNVKLKKKGNGFVFDIF